MKEKNLINQGTVTVEVHTQLRNTLNNSEREKFIRNHPLIHGTIIISVIKVAVGNQIRVSDVDQRIISSQIF